MRHVFSRRIGGLKRADSLLFTAIVFTAACLIAMTTVFTIAWPSHDSQTWADGLEDDAGLAYLNKTVRNPGELHLRGQVDLLGRAVPDGSAYTSALACAPDELPGDGIAEDGIIYGSTMANAGREAVIYRYDPSLPWTDDDHLQPGSNPFILGEPFPQGTYGWINGSVQCVWDVIVHEGKVYGGFYYWLEADEDHCRQNGGRVFVYDPSQPWNPGMAAGNNPRDLGQAVPGPPGEPEKGEAGVFGLCVGNDGWIYGGTVSSMIVYKQPPPPGMGGHVFRLDPTTIGDPTPFIEDLGQVDPGTVYQAWSVTPHHNTLQDKIYVGTGEGARVYELDTTTPGFNSLGRLEPGADYGYVSEMLTGLDGRVYAGSYPTCRLGVYDPSSPGLGLVDLGTAHDNQRELPGLTNGLDGNIYLATYGHSRMGQVNYSDGCLLRLDPSSVSLDPPSVTLENLGPALGDLGGEPYTPMYWVDGLCTGDDGRIFGGGNNTFMSAYDPAHVYDAAGEATSICVYPDVAVWGQVIPRPNTVNASQRITGMAPASDGRIYGGTVVEWWGHPEHSLEKGGRLFYYQPAGDLAQGTMMDLGQALATEYGVWSPVEGPDGAIYFGTQPHGHLGRYLPGTDEFQDLGIPYASAEKVTSLALIGDTLYGGTDFGAYMFSYNTTSGVTTLLGQPAGPKSSVDALLAGEDGLLYGTCGSGAVFFAYDPSQPWDPGGDEGDNPHYIVVPGYETHAYAMAWGPDDRVYISTYVEGRIYSYDPESAGIALDYPGGGKGIYSMVRGSDGKLYAGTEFGDASEMDHELLIRYEDGTYTSMPWVCGWEDAVTALACGINGRIYGGTSSFGYFFEYEPGFWHTWDQAFFAASTPVDTSLEVDVLDRDENSLIDNVAQGGDISSLSPAQAALRLKARLSTSDESATSRLDSWSLTWTPGGPAPQLDALVEEDVDGDVYWGEVVELQGQDFGAEKGSSYVMFAGTIAGKCTKWSDTSILVEVPYGCSAGQVNVTTMNGTSGGLDYELEPHVFSIAPDCGASGSLVNVSDLAGVCFQDGALVKLKRSGYPDVDAVNVNVVTPLRITCDIDLAGVQPGVWDIYVENPGGRGDTLEGGFAVKPVVNASVSGAGGSVDPSTQEVAYGGTANVDLQPDPGYHIASISDNGSPVPVADPYVIDNITGNHEVVVGFSIDTFAVNATVSSAGGLVDPSTQEVAYGGTAKVDLQPDPGYHIASITDNGSPVPVADPYVIDNITGNHEVVVGFSIDTFAVNATVSSAGGLVVPPIQEVAYGGTANMDLQPDPGYHTAFITDNGSPVPVADPYVIDNITGNHEVVVGFAEDPVGFALFFAEGYTGSGFEEWLCLANPQGEAAQVKVDFISNSGLLETVNMELPARTRRTLNVKELVGEGVEVSVSITSDRPIAAERPMYFDYKGMWPGGHVGGPSEPSTALFFAEGYTGSGFEEWLCLANPQGEAAQVKVDFISNSGLLETVNMELPARTRRTLNVKELVGEGVEVSVSITSDRPIAAERPMYFDYKGMWPGGHVGGPSEPSTALFFAEGYTGSGFEEWLCLANPQGEAAQVKVDFISNSGLLETVNMELPARTRRTLNVKELVGEGVEVSVSITSDRPIAAERPMYFDYKGMWPGGHVGGPSEPSTALFFAEGYTGSGFEEWLCLANPQGEAAQVKVDFISNSGLLETVNMELPARTRRTLNVKELVGEGVEVSVSITSDRPIAAERPMYFDYKGMWPGGHVGSGQ